MGYTGKCKYEDFYGNCTVKDNSFHCYDDDEMELFLEIRKNGEYEKGK